MAGEPSQGGGTVLFHLGGLGDVCLSESTVFSLVRRFGPLAAVGNKPVLDAFRSYFSGVESIDGRKWARLFSESSGGPSFARVVIIGKDRSGYLRMRLAKRAGEVLFIDMYPDGRPVHVEDYQLGQLPALGITPVKRHVSCEAPRRAVLYAERAYRKRKWPVERFCEAYGLLAASGIEAVLMAQPGLALPCPSALCLTGLSDIARFFSEGGLFVSSDSGMAHFAARCGMRPLTLFFDADPVVWHPLSGEVIICEGAGPTAREVEARIRSSLYR